LPASLYDKVRELARRENISINQFIATVAAPIRSYSTGSCSASLQFRLFQAMSGCRRAGCGVAPGSQRFHSGCTDIIANTALVR
jgi:hypothetical protein